MIARQDGRVGVIGGGLGGLAAAVTLASRGYDVLLLERGEALGGKAARLEVGAYRFDVGPTILTMPSALRRVLAEAGERLERRLDLVALDPQWRCFWDGGARLDLRAGADAMRRRLEESHGAEVAAGWTRFMERSRRLHEVADRHFFWRPLGSMLDALRPGALGPRLLADLQALAPGRSVSSLVRGYVEDERVAQMLDHFTQYVGSAPDASPAVLCMIADLQSTEGVHYPRGGTAAVARALAQVAVEQGVLVRTETGVRRVLLDPSRRRVVGVETDAGEEIPLAAVVSNADAAVTGRDLVGGRSARHAEGREPACSGVVLYLGLDRGYEHLHHHGFVFSEDPHAEADAIFRRGEPAADPTCYVCAPARTDPSVAPEGGEALYVLVHVPWRRDHHDWARMLPGYRATILEKLRRTAGLEDLERRIVVERVMTPADIERRFSVPRGAIYGLASHGRFTGAFKPSNRSPDVEGLYLAGGAAHPGPGMPMVIMSGWIAADCLDRDDVAPRPRRAVVPTDSLRAWTR